MGNEVIQFENIIKRMRLKKFAIFLSFLLVYLIITIFFYLYLKLYVLACLFLTFIAQSLLLLTIIKFRPQIQALRLINFSLIILYIPMYIMCYWSWKNESTMFVWILLPLITSIMFNHNKKIVYFWLIVFFISICSFIFIPIDHDSHIKVPAWMKLWEYLSLFGFLYYNTFLFKGKLTVMYNLMLEKNILLTQTSEKLLESQKIKDHFMTNMNHELRTPLNAIRGISEILKSKNYTEKEFIEYTAALNDSSDHFNIDINDILDLSKLNENKLKLFNSSFSIKESLVSSFNILKTLAEEKGIDYKLVLNSTFEQKYYGDKHRLMQILLNLLTNAVKYTEKGFVKITCNETKVLKDKFIVEIIVEDSGIGIEASRINEIFEDFVQVSTNGDQQNKGTGLGLSITKKIIDLFNGTIEVQSQLNVGSQFKVTIPFFLSNIIDSESKYNIDIPNKIDNYSILVVDDNNLNIIVAKKLLKNCFPKSKIVVANDGIDAVKKSKEFYFQIILMDIQMPIMNGKEAAKEIISYQSNNNTTPKSKIIAMTANISEQMNHKNNGFVDFLSKPYYEEQLKEIILRHVD